MHRRGLKKQNAERIKRRFDILAAREVNGSLANQVAAAKYERSMRHFVGWEEPKFYSPYRSRDIRNSFAYIRHKYRVWRAFRDHTGHWPVLSIGFHVVSWMVVFGFVAAAFAWLGEHKRRGDSWGVILSFAGILVLIGVRDRGTRMIRKLEWNIWGT